jgi:hypothetical protein
MSFNDVEPGIGGMALGEMTFRLSSKILDNTAHGKKRFFQKRARSWSTPSAA